MDGGYNLGGGAEWMPSANLFPWGRSTSVFVSYDHTCWNKASRTMPAASPPFNYTWLRPGVPVAPVSPGIWP
jgi:hypothetical protein